MTGASDNLSSPSAVSAKRSPQWQDLFPTDEKTSSQIKVKVRVVRRSGEPFLILPVDSGAASKALPLYPAQTVRARLARSILGIALRMQLPAGWSSDSLAVNPEEAFADYLTQTAGGGSFPCFAILSGNAKAEGRRFVILLFNKLLQPAVVVKAGIGEPAIQLIEHEASFLTSVPPRMPGPPRILSTFRSPRLHALALNFCSGRSPRADEKGGMESLLASWIDTSKTAMIGELPAWRRLEGCRQPITAGWRGLEKMVCHPAIFHGDFAPWNIKICSGEWQVLDWERGELAGMPGWDWFHYVIQNAVLVRREPVENLAKRVEELLVSREFTEYADRAGIAGRERMLVLAYLSYAVDVLKQSEQLPRVQGLLETLSKMWMEMPAIPASQRKV